MSEEKCAIRKQMKARLTALPRRTEREEETVCRLIAYLQKTLGDAPWRIAAYKSVPPEFGTDALIARLFALGAEVYVPVTHGEKMTFVRILPDSAYSVGAFGVPEPVGGKEETRFDAVIVPLVAFDDDRRRLGHGKGYYDRFLTACDAPKIGVAFAEQKIRRVPTEAHDVPLDLVFFG